MPNRRTILPDARRYPRFAGVATFGRYPLLEHVAPENAPVDWAIYGAPFDAGVSYRPGARFGPRSIRDASQYLKPYHIIHDVMLTEAMSIADAGDAPVRPYSCEETCEAITAFAADLGDASTTRLLALGGDHSIALANLRATWRRRGKPSNGLALIHFDSHLDTVDELWGERFGHASPFIRAIEEKLVDPSRMISIGVKGPLNRADDLDFARDHGVTIVTYEKWRREGPSVINDFISGLADDEAYISFDIDVVDPACAPGTGTPSVGGFTSPEILELLRSLAGLNVVGADVVEVLPDRDLGGTGGVTALLAAHIAFEILCLDALWRQRSS
ncbi:MAG: agmatinase [Planctomycetota bacterium]|nr:agmatinase [Planctomycetota bacterium]